MKKYLIDFVSLVIRDVSESGTGLGLSLNKELVELQGGRIIVESTLPVGSSFTLYIPLYK